MANIGQNIKKIRLSKNMTQKQLGDLCGMADSAVRRYESGRANPKIETLRKIAKALEVNEQELLGYSDASYRLYTAYEDAEKGENGLVIGDILVTQQNLLRQYNKLNSTGKAQAIKRIKELQYIPEYTCEDDCPFD